MWAYDYSTSALMRPFLVHNTSRQAVMDIIKENKKKILVVKIANGR